MPKSNKAIDWEVYDESGDFIDILSMTRDEMRNYKNSHRKYVLKEIEYTNDRGDDTWEISSEARRDIHCVCIPKRRRKFKDVYETS